MMIDRVTVSVVALILGAASNLTGQAAPPRWSLGGGASYEVYQFAEPERVGMKNLSLLTLPVATRIPLGRAALEIGTAYARGEFERPDGSSASLAGMTDTQVSLAIPVGAVTLSAFGIVPTGTAQLTDAEAEVAGKLAADLLPFRISNWGTGGGFGLGSTVAHSFGGVTAGISAAYAVGREFEALDAEDFAYRPGNELRVRAGLDARVGASSSLGLQATYQKSSTDQLNGQNLYKPGTRLQFLGSLAFAAGARASGIVYGGVLHRSAGSYLTVELSAAAQDLFLAGAGFRLPLGRTVLLPTTDFRVFRTADAVGQGWVAGAGASLEWPLGASALLVPTVRGRLGSYQVRAGETTALKGVDLGMILRLGRNQ